VAKVQVRGPDGRIRWVDQSESDAASERATGGASPNHAEPQASSPRSSRGKRGRGALDEFARFFGGVESVDADELDDDDDE